MVVADRALAKLRMRSPSINEQAYCETTVLENHRQVQLRAILQNRHLQETQVELLTPRFVDDVCNQTEIARKSRSERGKGET